MTTSPVTSAQADTPPGWSSVFIPLVTSNNLVQPVARVNVPYFNNDASTNFSKAAIFWFGTVSSSNNYADVRFGYDSTKLWVHLTAFDRYMWYDPTPSANTLTEWDGATLYINTTGNAGSQLSASAYRFDASLKWHIDEQQVNYQTAFQGSGSGWNPTALSFTTGSGYRGSFNDAINNDGWTVSFSIPFTSLGLSGAPTDGSLWAVALQMHDRDSLAGPPNADTPWPAGLNTTQPRTWAQLRFGLPSTGALNGTPAGTTIVRRATQNDGSVPDSGVGGSTPDLCSGDNWDTWGNTSIASDGKPYGKQPNMNIQAQSDPADWHCYSKYYITFPLTSVPAGKQILSARLVLYQFGNSDGNPPPTGSLIQVFTVSPNWQETSITWNNAPGPIENVSQTLVTSPTNLNSMAWPKQPHYWDVSSAVRAAYTSGQPLSLALYEADDQYHSGKYFTSSDTGDWNIAGRPRLEITWGNP